MPEKKQHDKDQITILFWLIPLKKSQNFTLEWFKCSYRIIQRKKIIKNSMDFFSGITWISITIQHL